MREEIPFQYEILFDQAYLTCLARRISLRPFRTPHLDIVASAFALIGVGLTLVRDDSDRIIGAVVTVLGLL